MIRSLKGIAFAAGALFAGLYILNPTAGIFELIPDNIPLWGNLDEAGAMALLLYCIRGLRRLRAGSP